MTVIVSDKLEESLVDKAWRIYGLVVVFGLIILGLCFVAPKVYAQNEKFAKAPEFPYLSARPKVEVCSNWAQNAAAGSILAVHGKDVTDDLFGAPSEHPDADAWVKKAAHAGHDWIVEYLKSEGHKDLPADKEVFEHIGSLAFNACMSDEDAPGIVDDGSSKTEM